MAQRKYRYYRACKMTNQRKRAIAASRQKRLALQNQPELPIPPNDDESAATTVADETAPTNADNDDDDDDIVTVFQIVDPSGETEMSTNITAAPNSTNKTYSARQPQTATLTAKPNKMPSITRILVAGEPAPMASATVVAIRPRSAENGVEATEPMQSADDKCDVNDDTTEEDDDESVRTASDRDSPISELAFNGDFIVCKYCQNNVRQLKEHYMWIHTEQYQLIRKAFFTKHWLDNNQDIEDIKRKFAEIFTDIDRYATDLRCELDSDDDDGGAEQRIDDDEF